MNIYLVQHYWAGDGEDPAEYFVQSEERPTDEDIPRSIKIRNGEGVDFASGIEYIDVYVVPLLEIIKEVRPPTFGSHLEGIYEFATWINHYLTVGGGPNSIGWKGCSFRFKDRELVSAEFRSNGIIWDTTKGWYLK